jgi:hypothetical protein
VFGYLESKVSYNVDFGISRLKEGISCSRGCVFYRIRHNSSIARRRRFRSPHCIC